MKKGGQINGILARQMEKIFVQTLVDLKTKNEAESFLNSFFSTAEKENFIKRLGLLYWLKKGRSYSNIKENLKVSSATIASMKVLLDKKGIQEAIKKIEAEEWANQWSEKIKKFLKT